MIYKQATRNELENVAKSMAVAFIDYPFIMSHSFFKHNFKNDEDALHFLEEMCFIYVRAIFNKVTIWLDMEQNKIRGLAILSKVENMEVSIGDLMVGGLIQFLPRLCKKYALRFIKFFLKGAAVLSPEFIDSEAWYLHIFAINPNYQGKQVGSKLMNECLFPYIRNQQGSCLATSTNTELALKFYTKNGFELLAKEQLSCHGTGNIDKFIIRHTFEMEGEFNEYSCY